MTRATIRFQSRVFNFATVTLPDGLPTRPQLSTQVLEAPGIDGTVTINERYAFMPFRVAGILSMASLAAAQTAASDLVALRGVFAQSFGSSVLGVVVNFQDIQMIEVQAVPRRDIGGGSHAVSGQAAVVEVSMVLRPTKGAQR